ncbi:MAG: hypothetical protein AAGJ85_04885 [Pseudomonadota bacterium]
MQTLLEQLRHESDRRDCLVIGLTGSVASGKTTLAGHLAGHFGAETRVETASTDGFLFTNEVLNARGLAQQKGFPETYDRAAMAAAIEAVRTGPATFPTYSHVTFDPDPEQAREIVSPDVLILEGLGFGPPNDPRTEQEPDILIYLDAEEADLVYWFVERFVGLWRAAADDPASFYAQWLHMTETELRAFAVSVWERINLPNLHQHILPLREVADVVLHKTRNHEVSLAVERMARV